MAIDLNGSSADLKSMKDRETKPEYEEGFGPDDDLDFDFNFDDLNDFDFDGTGNNNMDFNSNFNDDFFGSSSFGGTNNNNANKQPAKKDMMDVGMDLGIEALGSAGRVLKQLVASTKNRNLQELGELSKNMLVTGMAFAGVGVAMSLVGMVTDIKMFKLLNTPITLILSGANLSGIGVIGLVGIAHMIDKGMDTKSMNKDTPNFSTANTSDSFGGDFDFGSDYGDDDEDDFDFDFSVDNEGDLDFSSNTDEDDDFDFDFSGIAPSEDIVETKDTTSIKDKVENIPENVPLLTRQFLVDTFKPLFMTNTPGFSNREVIESGSDLFDIIKLKCVKAIASATRVDFESLDITKFQPQSIIETLFTYEILIPRSKKACKPEDLEKEIVAYFNDDADDSSIMSSVKIQGDYYKIVVYKGTQSLITLGDILSLKESEDFFKSPDVQLPICVGIAQNGQPILRDARTFETLLIAGKPRMGKSWFTFNVLVNLMAFNTPEDVQFIIIDPKNSPLMTTLGLMPHVAGLHSWEYILEILEDVVESEGARREKLLLDHDCDDIWALRKKTNIKLPVLYIFIDEFMTVMSKLRTMANGGNELQNKLTDLLKVIITNFPSKGIRMIFVPHRPTGVVDRNIRENIAFKAAVGANTDVVKETLGISKFKHTLSKPGDAAVMMAGDMDPIVMRGNAICTTDDLNKEFVKNMAKAFYKMGFEQPDMRSLKSGFNRDEKKIMEQIQEQDNSTRIQLSADIADKELEELIDL